MSQAGATIQWDASNPPTGQHVVLTHMLSGLPPGASTVSADGTFTIEFTATATTAVILHVGGTAQATIGVPFPATTVDLNADGSIELDGTDQPIEGLWNLVLTPGQPLRVAIAMHTTLPPNLVFVNHEVEAWLQPDNHLFVQGTALACGSPGSFATVVSMQAVPSFADTGLDATCRLNGLLVPTVHVIGFAQQPVLLPGALGVPCLLMPSPDILLFAATGQLHLPLPLSVRPVTFQMQGVALNAAGLLTSSGVQVVAQ